jgi:glycerophosphoryl diester phosphodiesterase
MSTIEKPASYINDVNYTNILDEVIDLAEDCVLDAGSWFDEKFTGEKISTVGEIFDRYNNTLRSHIEIKSKEAVELASRTCDLVRKYGLKERTTITSFWKQWFIVYPVSTSWTG